MYFGNSPPVVYRVGTILDVSGIGSEVWQGQLPLVTEHALSPLYIHVSEIGVPPCHMRYVVTAVDVPNIPTGRHWAPSPEPPLGHVSQTLATCILVHVAS